MTKIDKLILETAIYSPMAWTLKTEQDKQNLCEFVKEFALSVLHDKSIQYQLLKEDEF